MARPKIEFKPWEAKFAKDLPHGKATRVAILIQDYLKHPRYKELSNGTKRSYMSAIRAMELLIMPNGNNLLVMYAHMVDYGTADYVQGVLRHHLKPASIIMYFSLFSSVWDVALRNGKVAYNPWAKSRIKVNNLREITWTPEQIHIAVTTAKQLGYNVLALYLQLGYATAQRPWRDLRDLKWSNLKLDKTGCPILDFIISKTNTHIMLPLDKETYSLLLSLTRSSEYIFAAEDGSRLTQQTVTGQFNKVKKFAMLDKALLIRDLRRTAVTEMAMAGATVSEITSATGWRVSEKMLKRYAVVRLATAKNCLLKRLELQNADSVSNSRTALPEVAPKD